MELTIDTASDLASVALSEQGALLAEVTWEARREHSAQLLPAVEHLLAAAGAERTAITAVFVNRGPGGYAGLRAGIGTALALAFALEADVLGYGRLEADALPWLGLGRLVLAVHNAGRREYAWAIYGDGPEGPVEQLEPRIGRLDALAAETPVGALIVGEPDAALGRALDGRGDLIILDTGPERRRAATGLALAWRRYAAGQRDSRHALAPTYLKEPHITRPRSANGTGATEE